MRAVARSPRIAPSLLITHHKKKATGESSRGPRSRGRACVALPGRLDSPVVRSPQQVVNLEGGFLRRGGEAARDTLLHAGHQDVVPKRFPALLRIEECRDRPAVGRRACRMKELTLRQ